MGQFDSIRPYDDAEVPAVLARLLSDKAFLDILTHFRFPRLAGAFGWLLKPLIAHRLRKEFAGVTSVATLQDKVEVYVDRTIEHATDGVTYSGVDELFRDLRLNGAVNAVSGRRPGLVGRGEWRAVCDAYEAFRADGRLPATLEVIYGHAWKAAPKTLEDGRSIIRFDPKGRGI